MEVSKHHALNGPGYNAKRIFDRHASFPFPGVGIFHCEVNITAASYLCHQVIIYITFVIDDEIDQCHQCCRYFCHQGMKVISLNTGCI